MNTTYEVFEQVISFLQIRKNMYKFVTRLYPMLDG